MKPLATVCVAWLLVAGPSMLGAQTTAQAEKLLESARHKEVMDGDLKAAIEQYRKVAAQFAKQPEIAARALFQLGQCQEKLGQAEARKSYERIVREYGGAQQYATAARARLAAMGAGGPAGQQATRAVWTGPKADGSESSLSPDGRFISFPDWDTGNLGLHDLVTGADRPLTNTGTFKRGETVYAEASAISRDGKQVAYAWYDDKTLRYELRVISLNGDPKPRRVFGNPDVDYLDPRAWSPDGKWIAASLWSKRIWQIGLIGAQDGSLRLLKFGTDNLNLGGLSPDGRYIIYTRKAPGGVYRGYILSMDGKAEAPLIEGTSSAESPVWTPDGSRIVFVSDRSGSPGLWCIRVADGKPLGEPEQLKTDFSNAQAMGFARDGSLFYVVNLKQTDIYVAGLDPATGKLTSEPRRVNQRAVGNSWGRIAWLPDGKSLSFWNRAPITALVVHALATREEREIWGGKSGRGLAAGGTAWATPGWFPDGKSLMTREKEAQNLVFRRVNSKTGEAQASWTVPALPEGAREIGVSPDLMTVFFWQKEEACLGPDCTWVMRARELPTGRDREIFRTRAASLRNASISPDGGEIAFTALDGVGRRLMAVPTVGGEPRELYRFPDEVHSDANIAWTQDGGHVLAFRRLPAGGEVWSIPTKGGSPEISPLHIRPSEPPVVSPDGTQVAFAGGNNRSEIWVMTGLFQDTKPAAAH